MDIDSTVYIQYSSPLGSEMNLPNTGTVDGPFSDPNSTLQQEMNETANVTVTSQQAPDCSIAFKFWFATVGIGSVCVLGLLGNTLSILVLQKDSHNRVACFLLQALAFADNALLLLSLIVISFIFGLLPTLIAEEDHVFNPTLVKLKIYIAKYINPVAFMSQCCTVWITVLLAINRYLAICKPFIVHTWCTITRARIQVLVVITCSVLFNIPRFFALKIVLNPKENPKTGEMVLLHDLEPTAFGGHSWFYILYNHVLLTVLVVLLPLAILITLNSKLVMEIRKMQRRAKRNNRYESLHEDNITLVMIVIIVILLVCQTPDSIRQFVEFMLTRELRSCQTPFYFATLVCNLLIVLNSSVNFILYYFMRRGFRKVLFRKLCGCVKRTFSTTSTMLNGIGQSKKTFKLKQSRSCPELMGLDNRGNYTVAENGGCVSLALPSLEELRKTSI